MSSFTEHTNISPYKNKWINTKNFVYYISDAKEGEKIEVEAWFEFNWCSIPICILGAKIEPETITACCLHDWLYKVQIYSFMDSNIIFREALRVSGVWIIKRWKYFIWVSLFWIFSWINNGDIWKHD